MGCIVTSVHVRYCENPGNDYDYRGVLETMNAEGVVQIQSRSDRSWRLTNLNGEEKKIIYVFPMLNGKLSRLTLSFYYWGTNCMVKHPSMKPIIFLEMIRPTGETFLEELQIKPLQLRPILARFDMNIENVPILALADTGSLLRLKAELPLTNKYLMFSGMNACLYPALPNLPAARLPFEEFIELKENMQTMEIKSYRTWYLHRRHKLVGWVNTVPLNHCPEAIEVSITTKPSLDPHFHSKKHSIGAAAAQRRRRSAGGPMYFRFDLELLRGEFAVCSIPIVNNLAQTTHLRISKDMTDPLALKFFHSFEVGDQIQVARFEYGDPSMIVQVSGFFLKLMTTNTEPFYASYNRRTRPDALLPIHRENQLFTHIHEPYYYDPYDFEHFKMRESDGVVDMYAGADGGGNGGEGYADLIDEEGETGDNDDDDE